jgi:hypothetical protein
LGDVREGTPMDRRQNARWLAISAVVLAACASGPTQLYPDPPLERHQVALLQLESPSGAKVIAVDEEKVSGSSWYVAPGRHMIWVRARASEKQFLLRFRVVGYCLMRFEAAPGGTYTLAPDIHKTVTSNAIQVDVGVKLFDQTGTVVAASAPCLGRRPALD